MHRKLLDLYMRNQGRQKQAPAGFASQGNALLLEVTDVIDDWYGFNATDAAAAVRRGGFDTVDVVINSPGGDVFTTVALVAALRSCGKPVNVDITGVAASAASVLAMAGTSRRIYTGAMLMYHRAWTLAVGNANDMRDVASLLDKLDGQLAAEYDRVTSRGTDVLLTSMDKDTWLTATEALEQQFVTEVYGLPEDNPMALATFDLSVYDNAPAVPALPDMAAHRAHLERRLSLYTH